MKKKIIVKVGFWLLLVLTLLTGCGEQKSVLPDGIYTADFDTDSGMFRVNETCDGKGTLTVENGEMTIHISLGSKNILHLYPGLAQDAQKENAKLLMPTEDMVTYSDGWTETVYGFDIPVPVLEEEFDVALIGKKGKWYDHKVCVSNPKPLQENVAQNAIPVGIEEGSYTIELTLEGGSGKAEILSPAKLSITQGGMTATIQWNSPNYDYMLIAGEKYLPVYAEGNSVFEIPVAVLDEPICVIGDTVAMSRPHEIEYMITFHSDTMKRVAEEGIGTEGKSDRTLVYKNRMELQYAENFAVDYYEDGYVMLTTTADGARFLIVPEGKDAPQSLEADITVLKRPIEDVYLVASGIMDMFCGLDGLDAVSFSGQKEENWYIEKAKAAMSAGNILYAGKYNKPDYELIVSKGCSLAIQNRMILHSPEVVERLEGFGIPVMIEYSSYEPHPLGRVEWIKFFGALLGREAEAEQIFKQQTDILHAMGTGEKSDKTVAFFFITSNGLVQVRQTSDYVPKMIELAGGNYFLKNAEEEESGRSTMNMQIEEFYRQAKDADFLIYNSSIDGGVSDLGALLDKGAFLADFKAVKEGNVWCTTNDMYQQSLSIGYLMEDIHRMLWEKDVAKMHYLFRLE